MKRSCLVFSGVLSLLICWCGPLLAQSEFVLQGDSGDLSQLQFCLLDDSLAQDSTKDMPDTTVKKETQLVINIRDWRLLSLININGGISVANSEGSDFDESGTDFSIDFFSVYFGFDEFHGLGLGASIFEIYDMFDCGSIFPVYLYYPIYMSQPEIVYEHLRPVSKKHVSIFAGGTQWGGLRDYYHFGIDGTIFTYPMPIMSNPQTAADRLINALPIGNFSFQAGVFIYSEREEDDMITGPKGMGFYVSVGFGGGGMFH